MAPAWAVQAWWGIVGLVVLFFLDTPFRTLRQHFVTARHRERLIMLSFELDLLALWAIATLYLHWRWPLAPAVAAPALAVLGLALTAGGATLDLWAKLRLGPWFSVTFGVKPGHPLVSDGPYAVTRHPMYTGILAMLAGGALVGNNGVALLLAALMALPFFFHTVYEEAMFEKHFGAPYFEYEQRVPRLLPWPRPGRSGGATTGAS